MKYLPNTRSTPGWDIWILWFSKLCLCVVVVLQCCVSLCVVLLQQLVAQQITARGYVCAYTYIYIYIYIFCDVLNYQYCRIPGFFLFIFLSVFWILNFLSPCWTGSFFATRAHITAREYVCAYIFFCDVLNYQCFLFFFISFSFPFMPSQHIYRAFYSHC